jgi:hypothetical protein
MGRSVADGFAGAQRKAAAKLERNYASAAMAIHAAEEQRNLSIADDNIKRVVLGAKVTRTQDELGVVAAEPSLITSTQPSPKIEPLVAIDEPAVTIPTLTYQQPTEAYEGYTLAWLKRKFQWPTIWEGVGLCISVICLAISIVSCVFAVKAYNVTESRTIARLVPRIDNRFERYDYGIDECIGKLIKWAEGEGSIEQLHL